MTVQELLDELLLRNPKAQVRFPDYSPIVYVVGSWDNESVYLSDEAPEEDEEAED